MATLSYLTVQDMMWVNLQLTKEPQPWNYATLEEGVFYQYGYGKSADLIAQAASFLTGFAAKRAFKTGNEACAFVGFVAFLEMNDHTLNLSDAEATSWVAEAFSHPEKAAEMLQSKLGNIHTHTHHGTPDARAILGDVLARYPETVAGLVKSGHVAALV